MLFKRSWFGKVWILRPWWSLCDPWWVATREMHVLKSFSSFEMSFNVDVKLHPPLRIFEQLKKWNTYENFWSFAFAIKINQEVRKFDRLSHPNRPFKTALCTFGDHWYFCHHFGVGWWHRSYFNFITCLDMNALFATSSSKLKRRISSWVKCLEYIEEFCVGSLCSPLFYEINPLLSPDISLFPGFHRREKELRVKLNPCAHLGGRISSSNTSTQRISHVTARNYYQALQ